MANPEHLDILKQGSETWNRWRSEQMIDEVDLREADLRRVNLSGADLSGADLTQADLSGANLKWADLLGADLSEADLRWADLSAAKLSLAKLRKADLSEAKLKWADLRWADLFMANLSGADLRGANFQAANLQMSSLDAANLADAKMWETLRAGWSIKGLICERVFWDKEAQHPTEYAPGEFEKLHSGDRVIELHYQGGIRSFELNTLPALIHYLEAHQGCTLRLKSVEEAPGGTKVSIVVEEAGDHGMEQLQDAAVQLQKLQLELRGEQKLRERLEIEKRLLLEEVISRLAAAQGKRVRISADRGAIVVVGSHATINDPLALKQLVAEIFHRRSELEIPAQEQRRLEDALNSIQEQLETLQPDTSVVGEGLNTVCNILEGAAGSVLASAWLPAIHQLLQRFAT